MRAGLLVAYAMPTLATQFVYASFTTVLPGVYAKYFGLSAAAIATALLVTRVFDAVSDPLIGHLSDITRSGLGRRKPWIATGTLITALAIWQVSQPDTSGDVALHFTFWSILFYLGWTMMEIPHTAWGSELTSDYDGRNRVFFTRTLFSILGPLCFAAIPVVIVAPTTEMTPQVMSAVALAFILFAPFCIGASILFVPAQAVIRTEATETGLVSAFSAIRSNLLFWRLIGIFLIGGFAAGINGTLLFIYVDTYLAIGEKLPYAFGAMFVAALLGLPLWLFALRFIDKHRAWALSLGMASLWVIAPALLDPGEGAFIPFLVMSVGLALSAGAGAMVPFSLLGDVIDYDEFKRGSNRAGAYFSVFTFAVKLNAAIGGSVAFGLLAFFGYDPAATNNTAASVTGLKATYAVIPGMLFLAAAFSVYWFPLNRRKHQTVARALARRALTNP